MPVKQLPDRPSLDHLKYQAKDLLKMHAARDLQAAQRIREFHPLFHRATDDEVFHTRLTLSDAHLSLSREYGFESWARLKEYIQKSAAAHELALPHHERIADATFRRAVELVDHGDAAGLRAYLIEHSELVHQHVDFPGGNYFRNPTLLEFVAENPVRRGTLPANIVEVAKVILDAGAKRDVAALNETLALVSSGRVPRECGLQIPLIELLCEYGADPHRTMSAALTHGEFGAVNALISRGAGIDLTVAAAMGLTEEARGLIANTDSEKRHCALALASQFGHIDIVRLLLDAGEDPSRYNPIGFHSHSTPLHQAAFAGHEDVVRLLVSRGARMDLNDTLWQGTPADWARHGGYRRRSLPIGGS